MPFHHRELGPVIVPSVVPGQHGPSDSASKLVLVDMGGNNNGDNLLAFWDGISNWINR